MWLKELKVAIIQKDVGLLSSLLEDLPVLEDAKEIETAIYLLKEAADIMQTLQEETKDSMTQLKKNIDFLDATSKQKSNTLDITS